MLKGEKIRFDIHNILFSIYKFNKTLNNPSIKKTIEKHRKEDVSFINNVTLNSMRLHMHILKIINIYIKKKLRDQEKIFLIIAITQIVYLDFKEYAVINCTVEIAKKLKVYHGLINASLKKISNDKLKLRQIEITFDDLPEWFKSRTNSLTDIQKKKFINNFIQEPSLHLVFKSKNKLENFEEKLIKTSDISGFLINKKNINEIKSFVNGDWWVQDFSSFYPLYNLKIKDKNKKFLDACAAPGGKSFQLLSRKVNLDLNDKNKSRIQTIKSNFKRLNFETKIFNDDFINFNEDKKYDYIIIDAPCSAIGTIRKNPEIFFKPNGPNFKNLNILQEKMLNKAAKLLNENGLIIYMVCSFLDNETTIQIYNFIDKNKEFEISKFIKIDDQKEYSKLFNKNFMLTLPDTILNYKIDGYFAAFLRKNK